MAENFHDASSRKNDSGLIDGAVDWMEDHKLETAAIAATSLVGAGLAAKFIPGMLGRATNAEASTLARSALSAESSASERLLASGVQVNTETRAAAASLRDLPVGERAAAIKDSL